MVKELKNWIYPLSPEEEGEGGGGVKTKVVNNLKHFLVCFLHDLYDKLQINIFPNSTTKLSLSYWVFHEKDTHSYLCT